MKTKMMSQEMIVEVPIAKAWELAIISAPSNQARRYILDALQKIKILERKKTLDKLFPPDNKDEYEASESEKNIKQLEKLYSEMGWLPFSGQVFEFSDGSCLSVVIKGIKGRRSSRFDPWESNLIEELTVSTWNMELIQGSIVGSCEGWHEQDEYQEEETANGDEK